MNENDADFAIVRVCARPVSPVMMPPELFSVSTPPHLRSSCQHVDTIRLCDLSAYIASMPETAADISFQRPLLAVPVTMGEYLPGFGLPDRRPRRLREQNLMRIAVS